MRRLVPGRHGEGRLAIRAAILGLEADFSCGRSVNKSTFRISTTDEKARGFEGAIRITLHAISFLFRSLAFLRISRKSLKFLPSLFSIPTTLKNKRALYSRQLACQVVWAIRVCQIEAAFFRHVPKPSVPHAIREGGVRARQRRFRRARASWRFEWRQPREQRATWPAEGAQL